jgi:hypothetical protein
MRLYKTGTRWCFWRWTFVDSDYITRLHILKTPWFAICLHWINSPDPEPYLHDHPVSFLSLILWGWYEEHRGERGIILRQRWWNWIRATDRHTICEVAPRGALTLCLMGPKVREWGFHGVQLLDGQLIPRDGASLYWKDYHHVQRDLAAMGKAVR